MNLLDYSLINNVEFGVLAEKNITDIVNKNNFFETSKNAIMSVIDGGYTIFAKRPNYSKNGFILIAGVILFVDHVKMESFQIG